MPIIVGLLAAGVTLAIDKYQERQKTTARNAEFDSHDQDTGFETGIISPDAERRREEEAFHELQNYADFQKTLSSKVLDEISRDYSPSRPYSPNIQASSNMLTGNFLYDPLNGARYMSQGRLSCPIVISQRALESDGPGWLRTYSPALMDCGIPQKPFLKFIDSFNDSLRFAPQLEAVNVAALESGIGWRDKNTNLAKAIPNAVRVAKATQAEREIVTFLDHANISFFSPRGLFVMIITSTPDDLSTVISVNIFDSSIPSTSDLHMQEMNFVGIDPGHPSPFYTQINQPQSRRPNKLQKLGNFISDYGERRAHPQAQTQPNLPLFSLISSISNRHANKDSRRRRSHRFQPPTRRPSGSTGVSVLEGSFGATKVGKPPGSVRGIVERMKMDAGNDTGDDRDVRDAEIQPGALYLVIVNDPDKNQSITKDGEIYYEDASKIGPALVKGKHEENDLFGEGEDENHMVEESDAEELNLDELMGGQDELPPRYSSMHPQHRARVQAWREENPGSEPMI